MFSIFNGYTEKYIFCTFTKLKFHTYIYNIGKKIHNIYIQSCLLPFPYNPNVT